MHQWLVLLSLNVIGPFASDAYLPNLPEIRKDLVTSSEDASLTIQVNWRRRKARGEGGLRPVDGNPQYAGC